MLPSVFNKLGSKKTFGLICAALFHGCSCTFSSGRSQVTQGAGQRGIDWHSYKSCRVQWLFRTLFLDAVWIQHICQAVIKTKSLVLIYWGQALWYPLTFRGMSQLQRLHPPQSELQLFIGTTHLTTFSSARRLCVTWHKHITYIQSWAQLLQRLGKTSCSEQK